MKRKRQSWDDRACDIAREIDKWESLKMDCDRILKELQPHSPLWVYRLRKYIRYLESDRPRRPGGEIK